MISPGELFSRIRVQAAVLKALDDGLGKIVERYDDGVSDHDFLAKAERGYIDEMAVVAGRLSDLFAEGEDMGVMDVIAHSAWAITVPEIILEGSE